MAAVNVTHIGADTIGLVGERLFLAPPAVKFLLIWNNQFRLHNVVFLRLPLWCLHNPFSTTLQSWASTSDLVPSGF